MPSVRLQLVREGRHQERKAVVIVDPTAAKLLDVATKKLKARIKSLRTLAGTVLDDDQLLVLPQDSVVVCCTSAPPQADAILELGALSMNEQTNLARGDANELSSPPAADSTVANASDGPLTAAAAADETGIFSRLDQNVWVLAQSSLVELAATKQLMQVRDDFPNLIALAVGMPDLHPGARFPIGAAFAARGAVLPFLVGGDVGCGMTLFPTGLKSASTKKAERWAANMGSLDGPWAGGSAQEWLHTCGVLPASYTMGVVSTGSDAQVTHSAITDSAADPPPPESADDQPPDFDRDLGTVGGGNHFAELQAVEEVVDAELLASLGIDPQQLLLLVHSGSRGLGQHVLSQHLDKHGPQPLMEGTADFDEYMARHDYACAWAGANRRLIAHRFLDALGCDPAPAKGKPFIDICHNSVVRKTGWQQAESEGTIAPDAPASTLWLHRKGAAPIDGGPVVIPGSRGAFSYLVAPTGNQPQLQAAAYSVAHGAGRKWSRSHALGVGQARFRNHRALTTTALGSHVVCDNTALLYEEAPDAYKEISGIVEDLVAAGVVRVVAVLRPVITYKSRSAH